MRYRERKAACACDLLIYVIRLLTYVSRFISYERQASAIDFWEALSSLPGPPHFGTVKT